MTETEEHTRVVAQLKVRLDGHWVTVAIRDVEAGILPFKDAVESSERPTKVEIEREIELRKKDP